MVGLLALAGCGDSTEPQPGNLGEAGTASGGTASGGTASGGTASGGTASGGTASGGTASGGTASGGTASGGTTSGGTTSGGTASGGSSTGGSDAGATGGGGNIDHPCDTPAGIDECKAAADASGTCQAVGHCACQNCGCALEDCEDDSGCVAIRDCAQANGCSGIGCLGPCGDVINANGGVLGPSVGVASALSDCIEAANCPIECP